MPKINIGFLKRKQSPSRLGRREPQDLSSQQLLSLMQMWKFTYSRKKQPTICSIDYLTLKRMGWEICKRLAPSIVTACHSVTHTLLLHKGEAKYVNEEVWINNFGAIWYGLTQPIKRAGGCFLVAATAASYNVQSVHYASFRINVSCKMQPPWVIIIAMCFILFLTHNIYVLVSHVYVNFLLVK